MWPVAAETVLLLVMSFLSSVLLLVAVSVAAYFGSVFACERVSIVCFSLFLFS